MGPFEKYEMRARLAPALLVFGPYVLLGWSIAYSIAPGPLGSSITVGGLILGAYFLSYVTRELGRRAEKDLWRECGGDFAISALKSGAGVLEKQVVGEVRSALRADFNIDLDAAEEQSPEFYQAGRKAFAHVKQRLRRTDPDGLWSTHLAEYGFLRNLLGSSTLWAINAAIAASGCWLVFVLKPGVLSAILGALCVLVGAMALVAKKWVLPALFRSVHGRYAESAWMSYLHGRTARNAKDGSE